jgi:4-amino-4-deoxy-L-arabinose transferase-like glycosyltransferase
VGGLAMLLASRLRRTDPRTGWLIAVGGAFVVSAAAFSSAQGIFHPYYVSLLAPFTAALVGAGFSVVSGPGRILAPVAVVAGMATELAVLGELPGQLETVAPIVAAVAVLCAAALAAVDTPRVRKALLGVALAALLVAPATWSVQTLGHATSGTFPAGGPASVAGMGAGPGGGGMFGSNAALDEAVAYAEANGGGTVVVSSQSAASAAVMAGADVAAVGGFSGRESEVSVAWLADRVADGTIRWVLTDGESGGMMDDGRAGSSGVMEAVASVCAPVSGVDGLYDCSGAAEALAALG